MKQSPFYHPDRFSWRRSLAILLPVVAVGVVVVASIRAAGTPTAFEAESGTLAGGASVTSVSGQSGTGAVKFADATPTPTPGGGSCPLPAYPTPSCTGVPAGTSFTNTVGTYTVTTAGQHIDKWHVTGDLVVEANNVVITNSQIDGTVTNDAAGSGWSFTITDSTVGPPGACTFAQGKTCIDANSHSSANCIVSPGIGESNVTATRVYVRGHDDGFRVGGPNVTVKDSYFYACYVDATLSPPDGSHSDGVQSYCGGSCSGINLLHNTIDLSGVPATFPVNLGDPGQSNVTINDNLLVGGQNYLMQNEWKSGASWTVNTNRFVKDTWVPSKPWPQTIGIATANGTCSHQVWSGNTVVTIDNSYAVTGTLGTIGCID